MSRYAETLTRWRPVLLAALVIVFGLGLLWPVPTGQMPLSADHTVHLTRIWMYAGELAQGHPRGWSSVWFFGTPVGDLYPVLGDVVIISLRWLTFGGLDWGTAYALGFTVVFVGQGLALMRAGGALGLGPLPGLCAALLMLADVGAYREGGWLYTVSYGVWPQALATALMWLGIGELLRLTTAEDPASARKHLGWSALALGGALLAHPMTMPALAVIGPICVLSVGLGGRAALQRATARGLLAAALGIGIASWWLLPMLGHRAWMSSYGWLHLPLSWMAEFASKGHFAQAMPAAVGAAIWLGLILVAIGGTRAARAVAASGMLLWLLASSDVPWALRLDLVAEAFTHLQYQRFLLAAKPALFLCAGAGAALLVRLGGFARGRFAGSRGGAAYWTSWAVVVGLAAWVAVGQRELAVKHGVGKVQLTRAPKGDGLDAPYAQLSGWMTEQWSARDRFYRATVRDQRNTHWFMDAPVVSEMPVFKQGFTPGDNFVHKPEAGPPAVLDRLQVRYEIRRSARPRRRPETIASFGNVHVYEREGWRELGIANLEGLGTDDSTNRGTVEVLANDPDAGAVRVRLSGADARGRLVFGVAGFPRWQLERDGAPVEWYEAPVVGDGPIATQAQRAEGELRGGKAHGDDGTEPTLIATDAVDGEYTLTYRRWTTRDVLGAIISAAALGLCLGLLIRRRKTAPARVIDRIAALLSGVGRPSVWATLALALMATVAVRCDQGRQMETSLAVGWLDQGRAREPVAMRAHFLKTDMLIRPAVVVDQRRRGPASVEFPGVSVGDTLSGWVALDDDDAKLRPQGKNRLTIETGTGGEWTTLFDQPLRHRPGRLPLAFDTSAVAGQPVDVRVTVTSEGDRPPAIGFDLELGAAP